jgi:hypothetical protein
VLVDTVSPISAIVKKLLSQQEKGHFDTLLDGRRVWVKFGTAVAIQHETAGSTLLSNIVPTARLLGSEALDVDSAYAVYEFLSELSTDEGLFAYSLHSEAGLEDWKIIRTHIERLYTSSQCMQTQGPWIDYFTKDRVQTRLKSYSSQFINEWSKKYTIAGEEYSLDLDKVINETERFFKSNPKQFCVLGQSDLNDRNITRSGAILDYEGGGLNPLAAEAATFWVYYWLFTGFVTPKYQAESCPTYMKAFNLSEHGFKPENKQRVICTDYFEKIIEKNFAAQLDEHWYEAFRAYATMRILCVVDVSELSQPDIEVCLAHLALVHSAKDWRQLIW